MMNQVLVYINGEVLDIIVPGAAFAEELSEVLDGGVIKTVIDDDTPYKPYTDVEVSVNGQTSKYYIIGSDLVEIFSKMPIRFTHTVTLIEPTKFLEKITMPSQAFTGDRTMLRHIQNALINAEPVYGRNQQPRFKLDAETEELFRNVPGEDFFFDKPTLREVLDAMFSVIGHRPEVKRLNDYDNIVISSRNLNHVGDEVKFDYKQDMVVNIHRSSDIGYKSDSTETYAENALDENRTVTHGWDTLKSSDGQTLTTENAALNLQFPIYEIKKVMMWAEYQDIVTSIRTDYTKLDITKYFLDEEVYNTLTVDEKEKYIPYQKGATALGVLDVYKKWIIFDTYKLNDIVKDAASEQLGKTTYRLWSALENPILILPKILFKVEYTAHTSSHASLSKINEPLIMGTSQYDNQNEKNINLARYGSNLRNKVNQIGNDDLGFDCVISKRYNNMVWKKLGDYIYRDGDKYVISNVEFSVMQEYIKVRYDLTKNFSNTKLKTTISRERRVYNIPLENIKRDNLIKQYCAFSLEPITEKASQPLLNKYGLLAILRMFVNGGDSSFVNNVMIRTSAMGRLAEEEILYYLLDINDYVFGNSNVFSFQFKDNFSAGYGNAERIFGGRKVAYNPYVDDNGNYGDDNSSYVKLFLCRELGGLLPITANNIDVNKYDKLPKAGLSYGNVEDYLNEIELKTYKDAFVQDAYSLQIEYLSTSKDIIIGEALAKYNNLIGTRKKLFVYTSDETYANTDTICKGINIGECSPVAGEGSVRVLFNEDSGVMKFDIDRPRKSFAIGTYDRELVFAVNSSEMDTIHIVMTEKI